MYTEDAALICNDTWLVQPNSYVIVCEGACFCVSVCDFVPWGSGLNELAYLPEHKSTLAKALLLCKEQL